MSKPIGPQAREIVYKVYTFFKERKKDRSSQEYQNDVNLAKTVAAATGISEKTVRKIASEGIPQDSIAGSSKSKSPRKNPKKRMEVDSFTLGVIRRKVSQYYTVKKNVPSLRKLRAELIEEKIINCSHEHLRKILLVLGFKFISCQSKRKLLIERHDIMTLRWRYIRDITKYRAEKRPIVFLDETYVNQSHNVSVKEEPGINKGPGLIIIHAGGPDGRVSNGLLIFKSHSKSDDYHGDNFHMWTTEKLLPNIPRNSVVVMDYAAYDSTQIDKKPTMSSLKCEMQEWLKQKNIPFDESAPKCDLMTLINQQKIEKQYEIDEIIKTKGHTVLRLPPYHPDLNPIKLVWEDIKGELARTAIDSNLEGKKEALTSLFANYTAERWRKCDDQVKKHEEEYLRSDRVFDDEMDRMIKNFGSEDTDTDDDDGIKQEESDMDCDYDDEDTGYRLMF